MAHAWRRESDTGELDTAVDLVSDKDGTGILNATQQEALANWVTAGGVLIIMGNSENYAEFMRSWGASFGAMAATGSTDMTDPNPQRVVPAVSSSPHVLTAGVVQLYVVVEPGVTRGILGMPGAA